MCKQNKTLFEVSAKRAHLPAARFILQELYMAWEQINPVIHLA